MFDKFTDIVNVKDVCKMLNISKNTVYMLIRSEQLPAKRIGRIYRIRKADVIFFTEHDKYQRTCYNGYRAYPGKVEK